jgi:outer membrane beta-barrel protein
MGVQMRFNNLLCQFGKASVFILLVSDVSLAGSDKYKRPSTHSDSSSQLNSTAVPAGSPAKPVAADGQTGPEKKVDLTDLENRYWTAKDTEFNVVQNRLYTKAKKFSFTLSTGPLLTDTYTNSWNLGGALNYYFSERMGVEIQGWKTSAADADFVNTFATEKGAYIDHNMPQGFLGASFNWIPIYAKMSVLEKKILYFDFSVSPGLGVTLMKSSEFSVNGVSNAVTNQAPLTFALDIAEQVFLSEHFAIRLDVRNHFYSETIYPSSPVSTSGSRSKSTYYGTILLGVTLFQ